MLFRLDDAQREVGVVSGHVWWVELAEAEADPEEAFHVGVKLGLGD